MRLTDLVPTRDALLEKPDLDYALIRRENIKTGEVTVFSVSPRVAFSSPDSRDNLELNPMDQVFFFDGQNHESRLKIVNSLLDELRLQTRPGANASLVSVSGPVHFPGEYPLAEGMRVSDLILAGGNMKDDAYVLSAELTRYHYKPDGGVGIEHLTIGSLSDLANNTEQDLLLHPYDNLRIKPLPDWAERGTVEILGEVRFPGIYPIRRGETLSEALTRAGGLTEHAFADGSVFLRESLKIKEAKRKEQLMARLEADLALLSIEKASGDALQAGSLAQSLLAQLRKTESVGRMVINLSVLLDEQGLQPLFLEKGDKLVVPIRPQEVMVMGEVQHPTSHLYNKRLGLKDYVSLSGGFTYKADQKRAFVVKADGSVGGARGSSWFPLNSSGLNPGDTVVVPLDVDRGQALKKIANVTQIVYQMALAAAAVNSF
jgi:protein involved in polysaccharide export with SLBB domain